MLKYNMKTEKFGKTAHGYLYFCDATHPLSISGGVVYLHRHLASMNIGRWLKSNECVHHIDGDKQNNEPSNLIVLTARAHQHVHHGAPKKNWCRQCGKETSNKYYCSHPCAHLGRRKVERPTKTKLRGELNKFTKVELGRKYGVSDNAIKKWAKKYGLI